MIEKWDYGLGTGRDGKPTRVIVYLRDYEGAIRVQTYTMNVKDETCFTFRGTTAQASEFEGALG